MWGKTEGEKRAIDKVVRALQKVPEKRLLIIELANTIPMKGGDLDPAVLSDMIPTINLATAEAVAYGAQTIQAVDALVRVHGQPETPVIRPLTVEDVEAGLQF